jgi:hypothetical protein
MGMANKAPMDSYKRTYYVSDHAVQRLRERIGEKHSLSHRDDADLRNAIDEAVKVAVSQGKTSSFDFDGTKQKAVDISDYFGFSLRAIVANNDKVGTPWREAVVTVLSQSMAVGRGGAALGEAISNELHAALRASVKSTPPQVPPDIKPVPPAKEQSSESLSLRTRDASGTRLIEWLENGEGKSETVADHEVVSKLLALHGRGVPIEDVAVWKPTRVALKLAVEED